MKKINVIRKVCEFLDDSEFQKARETIQQSYPFEYVKPTKRIYTKSNMLHVFLRDGFIDRYSGGKLIFPPVLRVISEYYPKEFPFHPNWKMSESHYAYWELTPTIDHIIPAARGGSNDISNLVSTTQIRNRLKANYTLEELGWSLHSPGSLTDWDGLVQWFINHVEQHPDLLNIPNIKEWYTVAFKVQKEASD